MNKRLEEKLAMMAFGDLSLEESQRLEHDVEADSDASKALAEYRRMRTGLKALADVPEHQLSTERLRNAILTQGLKPKSRPQIGWLWMPAAAAALAFGVVMVNKMNQAPLPGFAGIGTVASVTPSEGTSKSIFVDNGTPSLATNFNPYYGQSAAAEGFSTVQAPAPVFMETASRHSDRGSRSSAKLEALKLAVAAQFDGALNTMDSHEAFASSRHGTNQDDPMTLDASARQPKQIVLVDSATDSATGAQKAKEVDSSGNVLVGG